MTEKNTDIQARPSPSVTTSPILPYSEAEHNKKNIYP